MEGLKTSTVSISNGSTEKFQLKIYFKNWFSDRVSYVIIADTDIESLQSFHTLFDKYWDHMLVKFEQNRIFWIILNFDTFNKKPVNNFWQSIEAILEDVLWMKQLFGATLLLQRLSSFSAQKFR